MENVLRTQKGREPLVKTPRIYYYKNIITFLNSLVYFKHL